VTESLPREAFLLLQGWNCRYAAVVSRWSRARFAVLPSHRKLEVPEGPCGPFVLSGIDAF